MNQLTDYLLVDQTLRVIDAILTSDLVVNEEILTNVVYAAHGIVTPSLFP